MAEPVTFGEWMKQARKELDLSQKSLAEQVGCAVVTIQKIEEGKRRPSRQVAELLCRHLKIPSEDAEQFLRLARASKTTGSLTRHGIDRSFVRTGNLPAPAAPFIGRAADIVSVLRLIRDPKTRLVTLVGPPGVGKTRLCIQAASQAQVFPDGTWFVPLAPLQDPDLVLPDIGHTLGMADVGRDELIKLLRNRSLLLLLDNCEHVLSSTLDIAELLAACAGIKVMATSRTPLELYGETIYRVEPLAIPADNDLSDPDSLLRSDAVALFVARAQAISSGFALTPVNAAQVVGLCRQLEGLPLAIELAAWGFYRYTLDELAAQIELASGPLAALQDSPRDFNSRHRSLRKAIAWSHNLLSEPERTIYRSLGVFHGEFSHLAVAGIADRTKPSNSEAVLRTLRELVWHSLLSETADPGSGPRYTMLETIRADALERCTQAGELDNLSDRHARWFLERMSEVDWGGTGLKAGLIQARADADNVRAALSWLIARKDAQRALQLCGALRRFWEYEGYQREGRDWLAQTLALQTPAPALLRAQSLLDGCVLAFQQGDYATAETWGRESLSLFQAADRTAESALVMLTLGRTAIEQGQYVDAEVWEEEALARYRSVSDHNGAAGALTHLAEIALGRGDDRGAQHLGEASLAITADEHGSFFDALSHLVLMEVALREGRLDQAQTHLLQSLETGMAYHAIRPVTLALALAAALSSHLPGLLQERAREAATLWGAMTELRRARGLSLSLGHRQRLDAYLAGARAALGPEAWQQAEEQGRQLSLEDTIVLAREIAR